MIHAYTVNDKATDVQLQTVIMNICTYISYNCVLIVSIIIVCNLSCMCKGAAFCVAFAPTSLKYIPLFHKVMALTATATSRVRWVILSSLDMHNSHLIIHVPNKINIKYHTLPQVAVEKILYRIVTAFSSHGVDADQTITFCRSYQDALDISKTLVCMLGRCNALYLVVP